MNLVYIFIYTNSLKFIVIAESIIFTQGTQSIIVDFQTRVEKTNPDIFTKRNAFRRWVGKIINF